MINPKELFEKAEQAAEDWADKDHAAGLLEDALSAMEGHIAAELKAKGESISIIPKLIKNETKWKELAKLWRDARKDALKAKLFYEQVNRYQDNIRSVEATTRRLTT